MNNILLSLTTLCVLSGTAMAGKFEKNCRFLVQEFGTQTLNYSYTNFQGVSVNVTPLYHLNMAFCSSDSDNVSVTASNAANTIALNFYGTADENGTITYQTPFNQTGNCADVAATHYIDSMRANNVVIPDEIEHDIRQNYSNVACVALRNALKTKLDEAAARANARP